MRKNDMKRVEELWKRIEYIGNASHFDDDTMTALGSVFGEMKSAIKQQQKRIESYGGALQDISDCNHIRDIYEAVNRADQALEESE